MERANNVFHVVGLAADQAAQMDHHSLGLLSLADDVLVGLLQRHDLLLVPLAFTLQLLGNLLLENQGRQRIVALFLGARKTKRDACGVVLVLVDEPGKTAILTLVGLDLDLELLGFLG
jgi:hypothetical protein